MKLEMEEFTSINELLLEAAKNDNLVRLKELVKEGADINYYRLPYGFTQTPIIHAAKCGSLACLEELIKIGGDVNFQNKRGETALLYALLKGHVKCVEMLLLHCADPNLKIPHTFRGGVPHLSTAVRYGMHNCVKLLLIAKADIDAVDALGMTALMHASAMNSWQCARILIDRKAQIDLISNDDMKALDYACQYMEFTDTPNYSTKSMKLLIEVGATKNFIWKKIITKNELPSNPR